MATAPPHVHHRSGSIRAGPWTQALGGARGEPRPQRFGRPQPRPGLLPTPAPPRWRAAADNSTPKLPPTRPDETYAFPLCSIPQGASFTVLDLVARQFDIDQS